MNVTIRLKQIDPEAKADSAPTTTNKQPWINIRDLKRDDVIAPRVMTLEPSQAILDGTKDEFPNDPENVLWGYWSQSMSNEQGRFTAPYPTIDITFGTIHKSLGLTLLFYQYEQDFVTSVTVTWYADNLTTVLKTGTYEFTNPNGDIPEPVENWRRIKIEFLSTLIPNRYVKMYSIEYGLIRRFGDEDIDTANLLEEIDPISDVVSVNTLGFTMRTHSPEFSPISGDISDDMLMTRQMLDITADDYPFGTFFLDGWKDRFFNGRVFEFSAIDAIGVMDGYPFTGGIYSNALASDVLRQIFDLCFPTQSVIFTLDDALISRRISGHIPLCTAREALQYICFALGAVADTSRRNDVWIYKRDTEIAYNIPLDSIYYGGQIEPTQYFSGLDLLAFEFQESQEIFEIQNGELPIGNHRFEFSEPFHSLTISGGTILASNQNYAVVQVSVAGNVILNGKRYIETRRTHSIREVVLPGRQENICKFDGCKLVDYSIAPALAIELFNYLKQRISVENDVRLNDLEIGYVAEMETYARPIVGTIERLDISLRGGRAKMRMIGDVVTNGDI